MKPLHGSFTRLRRCPCCQGKYSKNNRGSVKGNRVARQKDKLDLKKEI